MESYLDRLLQSIDKFANGKHTLFAKKADIPVTTFQSYVNGKLPKPEYLLRISEVYNISIDWLLTGKGDMLLEDKKGSLYNKVEDEDPEVADLLSRTMEILRSDTDYSFSLAANIRSFHHAIRMEKEVSELKSEVSYIKRTMNSKIAALEEHRKGSGKIRREDPPGKKEEFLKKRAM